MEENNTPEQETQNNAAPGEGTTPAPKGQDDGKKVKKHLIHPTWLRRLCKTLLGIVIAILLIPVLLYIPPVQTFVKDQACKIVAKSTGMKVEIGKFRLKFPLDIDLDRVVVLDQHADTMVRARKAVVDVKLMPLLKLDVQIKKLLL